ncbi:unnamed protein product, partial [Rotaria sp. Silwood1]
MFADPENPREGYKSVTIELCIDETMKKDIINKKQTYADISEESSIPHEDEVLFFMGFVWAIQSVEQEPNENTWKVQLKLSIDTKFPKNDKYCPDDNKYSYFTLGKILHELGEYADAMNFYDLMLQSSSDLACKTRADIHFHIAQSAYAQRLYTFAKEHLQKAEDTIKEAATINKSTVAPTPVYAENLNLSLMCISTNLGLVYHAMKDYKNARYMFMQALEKEDGSDDDKDTIIGMIARPKRIKFRESLTIFALQSMDFSLLLVTDDNVTTVHDTATQVNTIIGMIARPKRIKFRASLIIFTLQSMDFSLLLVTDDNVTTVHDIATQ